MPSKNIITPILVGNYYHIFNRGNNYENVFFNHEDYIYFLHRFKYHMTNCCETFAYALLPNHYHLLIKVKENIEDHLFSFQLKKLIQEYTFRINDREKRNGNLFLKPFRRLEINSDEYFTRLVFYIHANPYKHNICRNFKSYSYSSYKSITSTTPTNINRNDVLEWFGGLNDLIEFHNFMHNEDLIEKMIIE